MGFWDTVGNVAGTVFPVAGLANGGGALWDSTLGNAPGDAAERQRKQLLYQQAQQAGQQAQQGYNAWQGYNAQGGGALAALQRQAQGENSVSATQLRQALGQNLATQRSLAAGASPQNAAAAARTASIQSARLGSGLAGAQAVAGQQERNAAQQQYGSLLGTLSGQAASVGQGAQQAAIQGYGAGNAGAPEKSWLEKYGPALQGGLSAAAASDRRLKTDVRDGAPSAVAAVEGLKPYLFRYKDPRYGAGDQLGVMAQDLEKAGLGHAVIDTPAGKAVDGPKLATANTAMIAALGRRVAQIEQGGQGGQDGQSVTVAPASTVPAAVADRLRRRQLVERQLALQGSMSPGPAPARPAVAAPPQYWYSPSSGSGAGQLADTGGQ